MNIYVSIPGVNGMATDANHKGQVPVKAYAFRERRNVHMRVGYESNREGGSQSFSYFGLLKPTVSSTHQGVFVNEYLNTKKNFNRGDANYSIQFG